MAIVFYEKENMEKQIELNNYNKRLVLLLDETSRELRQLDIPIVSNISKISANTRAKSRFGCCKKIAGVTKVKQYEIEISYELIESCDKNLKSVIAHELIHTCPGCLNHGKLWKEYIAKVNKKYEYDISTTSKYSDYLLDMPEKKESYKYRVVCNDCGNEVFRKRKSKVIKAPGFYRCIKCGGTLRSEKI